MVRCLVLASLVFVACDRGKAPPSGTDTEAPVRESAVSSRAEWLAEVDAFVARGGSRDAEWTSRLARLVNTDVWKTLPRDAFAQHADEVSRFLASFKQLTLAVLSKGTVDDAVDVGMFGLDVYPSILRAAEDFLAGIPVDDPKRSVRTDGVEKMRHGAALEVAGLLYLVADASERRAASALSRLSSAETYAGLSREGLQLLLATLDEQLLPQIGSARRAAYAQVRDTIAAEHARRPERTPLVRTTYEGVGSMWAAASRRIVSSTGGFSVDLGPGALVKRVEYGPVGSPAEVHHKIELQEGAMRYEATCFDGFSEPALLEQLASRGAESLERAHPGTWLSIDRDGMSARMRILEVGGRACLALAEGPAPAFPAARVDAFLESLRAAP
jgi:hypothetical protein